MPALLSDEPTRPRPAPPTPEQGVIEEARRRRRRRWRRRLLGAALGAIALGALTFALSTSGSSISAVAEHTHTITPGGVQSGSHVAGFDVRLSPALDGGQSGWCVAIEEPGSDRVGDGGCGALPMASQPITMRLSSASAHKRQAVFLVLVTPQVTALLVNGSRRVPTFELPGLPYGLRAARIVKPLTEVRSPSGKLSIAESREPALTPLDAVGRVVPAAPARRNPRPLNLSPSGPCSLQARGLKGLSAQWSHIARAITPYPETLVGRAFFSCIDTEYYLHGWPLDVALLVDAAHPGSLPAPIPGLLPVEGDGAYVNGPGDFKGALSATRTGDAWLVVAGGSGLAQRLEVLKHLKGVVKPGAVAPGRGLG